MNDPDPIKAAAAVEISSEMQTLFEMIDGAPEEQDGWYTIARLYEIGRQSGKIADSISKDAFRFRITKLADAGEVERRKHKSNYYYKV